MPYLRLAYSALFLIALISVFVAWSQVAGQDHVDLLPWPVKLALPVAAAFTITRATAASVSSERGWNSLALRWLAMTLALLGACGYAAWYAHTALEDAGDASDEEDAQVSGLLAPIPRAQLDVNFTAAHGLLKSERAAPWINLSPLIPPQRGTSFTK